MDWEPSEYDYGYSQQYDPYEFSLLHRHNTCEKCGKIIPYTSTRFCQKHQPGLFTSIFNSVKKWWTKQ